MSETDRNSELSTAWKWNDKLQLQTFTQSKFYSYHATELSGMLEVECELLEHKYFTKASKLLTQATV